MSSAPSNSAGMPPSQQAEETRLIIHHLSDLHFHDDASNAGRKAFYDYIEYLGKDYHEQATRSHLPHAVIITGDLIQTGDISDLRVLAGVLRTIPRANGMLSPICVVPGPYDITRSTRGVLGFDEFYQSFSDYVLPTPTHQLPTHLTKDGGKGNLTLYPFDTCYRPETLPPDARALYAAYGNRYQDLLGKLQRDRLRRHFGRRRTGQKDTLHDDFLNVCDENWLALIDAGIVDKDDLATFRAWVQTLSAAPTPPADPPATAPLRILITHHPLLDLPDRNAAANQYPSALLWQQRMSELLKTARQANFQLALHGHIHKPHVLSDLSILHEATQRDNLRQVGAGSLGDSKTFNEITAIQRQGESNWNLEIRTVNVESRKPSIALMMLNPSESHAESLKEAQHRVEHLQKFQRELGVVTRQFTETVRQHSARRDERDREYYLPQLAMNAIDVFISDTIFENAFGITVGLALKKRDTNRTIWVLENTFLDPNTADPRILYYPASVAAWALILGRIMVFPDPTSLTLNAEDLVWLRESQKLEMLEKAMDDLQHFTVGASGVRALHNEQLEKLQALLEAIKRGEKAEDLAAEWEAKYQGSFYQPPAGGQQRDYPIIIAVPLPPRTTNTLSPIPEIGTLNINIRQVDGKPRMPDADLIAKALTADREKMLLALAELIVSILCSSSALGNPKGSWDVERFR